MLTFKDWVHLNENEDEDGQIDKEQEKYDKERDKIESKLFKTKIEKLNMMLRQEGIDNFHFNITETEDGYEFDIPMHVLFGPKTREFCADRWKGVMKRAEIDMDFSDEIHRLVNKMDEFKLTMKMNKKMTAETGEGEITDNDKEAE